MTKEAFTPQAIRRYLLGLLPEAETERLDELSVTDDDVAAELRTSEHDLVDAFVQGELEPDLQGPFRARYLASPAGRERVRFAERLQAWGAAEAAREATIAEPRAMPQRRAVLRWPLAAAAAIVVVAAGVWLVRDHLRVREELRQAQAAYDVLRRDAERPRDPGRPQPETRLPPTTTGVVALVLTPQLRSAQHVPAIAVSGDVGEAGIQLALEPVDYPAYEVVLVDAAAAQPPWQSGRLAARRAGERQVLDVLLPMSVLESKTYRLRAFGLPASGPREVVGEYPFSVVR